MSESILYVTCKTTREAEKIGKMLVSQKLVACVNILGGVLSLYNWENKVEQSEEVLMIVKTHSSQSRAVIAAIEKMHSYDVPCVVELPIVGGSQPFLQWIREQTL